MTRVPFLVIGLALRSLLVWEIHLLQFGEIFILQFLTRRSSLFLECLKVRRWSQWVHLLIFLPPFLTFCILVFFYSIFLKIYSTSSLSSSFLNLLTLFFIPRSSSFLLLSVSCSPSEKIHLFVFLVFCDSCLVSVISKLVLGLYLSQGRHSSEVSGIWVTPSYLITRHSKPHVDVAYRAVDENPGGWSVESFFGRRTPNISVLRSCVSEPSVSPAKGPFLPPPPGGDRIYLLLVSLFPGSSLTIIFNLPGLSQQPSPVNS